ncbi:MAG: hypothetical protein PHT49_05415 [Desulfovibrionales bacterium]|nr:hypothetical protein [Desulfovibrionales bacterium]
MKTIISFISFFFVIVMIALNGCTPGSIANLGVSIVDSYMESRAEDAKARRQAKYIAEEIQVTTNPADKALKNAKESIIKTKGKPNNVVKIDDAGSEVWEYYNSPEKGKVRLYAFLNGELKNVGSRNMDEYGANSNDMVFLKKRYIDTVPCYANLRNTPSPDDTPAATLEPTPAPMKPDNPK